MKNLSLSTWTIETKLIATKASNLQPHPNFHKSTFFNYTLCSLSRRILNFSQFCSQEVNTFHSLDQLNEFMLNHGENIVDIMGDEIDRIEMNLSVSEII